MKRSSFITALFALIATPFYSSKKDENPTYLPIPTISQKYSSPIIIRRSFAYESEISASLGGRDLKYAEEQFIHDIGRTLFQHAKTMEVYGHPGPLEGHIVKHWMIKVIPV